MERVKDNDALQFDLIIALSSTCSTSSFFGFLDTVKTVPCIFHQVADMFRSNNILTGLPLPAWLQGSFPPQLDSTRLEDVEAHYYNQRINGVFHVYLTYNGRIPGNLIRSSKLRRG